MAEYTLFDFAESINSVDLPGKPTRVLKAWGRQGDYAEWSGGFVMELDDGQYAYLSGWCDTTGWGCQDGADVVFAASPESLDLGDDAGEEWTEANDDLNRWIAQGMPNDAV